MYSISNGQVLGRVMCGDEGDRCIFGEALFVAEEVAGVTFPLLSFSTRSWKGGRGRWRLVDGLCLLPIKPLLRLGRLGCQALIWYYHFNHHIDQFHYHLLFVIHTRDLSRVATVHLPQRVPYGVHGLWLEKEFLDSRQKWIGDRFGFCFLSHKLYKTQSSQVPSSDNDDAATAEVMKWYFWIELSIGIH